MELMQWFLMGVLFTVGVFALAWLSMLVKLVWYTWAGLITGVVLILFGIGWAGASFLEGVSQSGSMALMLFSGPGIIVIALVWRHLVAPKMRNEEP
ncbi:MAG: dehalogenase [Pseudomonadota bacterium]|nr:dehalogenase [Pseudomonadota bacterium]